MRFMILVKATKGLEAGVMPSKALFAEMGRFNEALVKAGIVLAGEGLHPIPRACACAFRVRSARSSKGRLPIPMNWLQASGSGR